ncbi:MAG: AI-2E family transporter [Myxococcota bacterium]|nr:AI-2E family transporter [Myxococcota bacterium]
MQEDIHSSAALRWLVALAAFVVVVAGLKAAAAIVVPTLLAVFVAIICWPLLDALQERRVPTWLALLVVVGAVVVTFVAVGGLLGTSVNEFTRGLPAYEARLQALVTATFARVEEIGGQTSLDALRERVDAGAIFRTVGGLLTAMSGVFTNAFLILLTSIFVLLEASSLRAKVAALSSEAESTVARIDAILANVRRYLAIKTATSGLTGLLVYALLMLVGVDFAALWATLAFLLNYVPNIGSILASVPAILLALVQLGWLPAAGVAAGYVALNLAIGSGLEPRLMGRSAGLSTLVVFASLIFWGWVLGAVGMLLSVPLTMTVKVALQDNPSTRWVAILLGPAQPEAAARASAPPDSEARDLHEDPAAPDLERGEA